MKQAVIYTRVSSDDQVTGTSLDTQSADCAAYARRHGFDVVQTFTDAGYSAKSADNRPGLQQAVEYCTAKRPAALIVWKLDRLARNTADGLVIRAKLKQGGTELLSATEAVTPDAVGELVSTLLLSVAQFDNSQRATRCRRGMQETALRGGWCHKAPAGFTESKTADGLPVLSWDNPTGRTLAAALKGLAAGTVSKSQYYATCERIGIAPGVAAKIPHKAVYAGIIRSTLTGGQPVTAAFPGMISESERQAILRGRRKQAPSPAAKTDYRGILVCSVCGRPLTAYVAKGKYLYYKCPDGHVTARDTGIHAQIQQIIETTPLLAEILQKTVAIIRARAHAEYDARRDERTAIADRATAAQRRMDALTDRWLDGRIDDETYERKSAEYRQLITAASDDRIDAEIDTNRFLTGFQQTVEKLRNPATLLAAVSHETRKRILTILYGVLAVFPDKTIRPCSNSEHPSIAEQLGIAASATKTEKAGNCRPSDANPCSMVGQKAESSNFDALLADIRELIRLCA